MLGVVDRGMNVKKLKLSERLKAQTTPTLALYFFKSRMMFFIIQIRERATSEHESRNMLWHGGKERELRKSYQIYRVSPCVFHKLRRCACLIRCLIRSATSREWGLALFHGQVTKIP